MNETRANLFAAAARPFHDRDNRVEFRGPGLAFADGLLQASAKARPSADELSDAIVRMGEEYPVEAMRMMQVVAGRRLLSYLRVTDSGYTRRIAERVDAEIIDAVSHIIQVRADPGERADVVGRQDGRAWREREHHEQRMMLGAGHGGLGFTCGEHEADALHFASWAATLGSMITRFGFSDEEGGTASLRLSVKTASRHRCSHGRLS